MASVAKISCLYFDVNFTSKLQSIPDKTEFHFWCLCMKIVNIFPFSLSIFDVSVNYLPKTVSWSNFSFHFQEICAKNLIFFHFIEFPFYREWTVQLLMPSPVFFNSFRKNMICFGSLSVTLTETVCNCSSLMRYVSYGPGVPSIRVSVIDVVKQGSLRSYFLWFYFENKTTGSEDWKIAVRETLRIDLYCYSKAIWHKTFHSKFLSPTFVFFYQVPRRMMRTLGRKTTINYMYPCLYSTQSSVYINIRIAMLNTWLQLPEQDSLSSTTNLEPFSNGIKKHTDRTHRNRVLMLLKDTKDPSGMCFY